MDLWSQVEIAIGNMVYNAGSYWDFFILFFSVVIIIELPLYLIIGLGVIYKYAIEAFTYTRHPPYFPSVSCIVTCYSEGEDVVKTIRSLEYQIYKGKIEILMMVDGSEVNKNTLDACQKYQKKFKSSSKRVLRIIPKKVRGGRASSINLGLELSKGDILLTIDGDCSCDNDMVSQITKEYYNDNVIACAGTLRVRNAKESLVTRMQTLEYLLGIQLSKIGLASINTINNLSGAFSSFRKSFIEKTSGWRNGSAEDLDITMRLQSYFKRYKHLRIRHCPYAITHTDAPTTVKQLYKQRLRWDGDLFYIYITRYKKRLTPRYMGWKNFIMMVWSGVIMNAVLPVVIILNLAYLFFTKPFVIFLSVLILTYVYYLFINIFLFFLNIVFVSERKMYDLQFLIIIPLMPFYTMMIKFFTTAGLISEILVKSHKDSSMAPPWVNKKVK
jgi:cellulose synthase/poly-beta-1,6-N-acetylglucosamine synthase-like glycosyltransferase